MIGQYGYSAIFALLPNCGVPIPDQLVLVIAGYCVMTKSLNMAPTLIVASSEKCAELRSATPSPRLESFLSRFSFAAKGLEKAREGSSVSAVGH